MEAFTDPKIRKIVMVAASQVGKSELELNVIGYIIDQDPGSIIFVQPTLDDARKFSQDSSRGIGCKIQPIAATVGSTKCL